MAERGLCATRQNGGTGKASIQQRRDEDEGMYEERLKRGK